MAEKIDFKICLVLMLLPLIGACDILAPNKGQPPPEYMVESYQKAGQWLQPVYLSRTASLEEDYSFSELAVSGAAVRIEKIGPDGAVQETYPYREKASQSGVYLPNAATFVQPLQKYRLVVEGLEAGQTLRAETVVPDTFQLARSNADTLTYQGDTQLETTVTPSSYPGRRAIYMFVSEALEPRIDQMVPFYKGFATGDSAAIIQQNRKKSSMPINAAQYGSDDDGPLRMKGPWLMFSFYGPTRVSIRAIDDNFYDFTRSDMAQESGTTGPGEIPGVLEHVEGGTGVFSSYAEVSTIVYLRAPAGP